MNRHFLCCLIFVAAGGSANGDEVILGGPTSPDHDRDYLAALVEEFERSQGDITMLDGELPRKSNAPRLPGRPPINAPTEPSGASFHPFGSRRNADGVPGG